MARPDDAQRLTRQAAGLLGLLVAVVFGPSALGGFVFDDVYLIADNPRVGDLRAALLEDFWSVGAGLPNLGLYYRPVVKVAYALQHRAFGGSPVGFHLVSLALHAACVLLAFQWIRRRLPVPADDRGAVVPAAVGAALFAVHPSRPEVVTWISGSTDLWMTFFSLVGVNLWARATPAARGLALPCFALAFFSKESAIVLPLLLAVDVWARRPAPAAQLAKELGWVGGAALALGLGVALRVAVFGAGVKATFDGPFAALRRVATSLFLLVQRTVFPWPPSVFGGVLPEGAVGPVYPTALVVGGALLLVSGVLLGAVALVRPRWRGPVADLAWFAIALLPTLNVLDLDYVALVSDRFLYFPLLGLGALLARGVHRAWASPRAEVRAAVGGVAALGVLGLGALTALHVGHFQSNRALFTHEARVWPRHPVVVELAARTLWGEGLEGPAMALAEQRLALPSREVGRAMAIATWAYLRLVTTSDVDEPTLVQLRELFDSIAGRQVPGRWTVGRHDFGPDAPLLLRHRAELLARGDIGDFVLHRALAHLRTGRRVEAQRILSESLRARPGNGAHWELLVRAIALEEEWARAEGALRAAEQRLGPSRHWPPLRQAIGRGRQLARPEGDDPAAADDVGRRVDRVDLFLALGSPRRAREELEGLGVFSDLRAVQAGVRIHLADRRVDLATELVREAMEKLPGRRETLAAALTELEELEREGTDPR